MTEYGRVPQASGEPSSPLARFLTETVLSPSRGQGIVRLPQEHYLSRSDLPTKRRVFVSYHHHRDQAYRDALVLRYCDEYELLEDRSVDREIDSDDVEYVDREIREEYICGASATVVLCGLETATRKFVDWEIFATLLKPAAPAALVGIQLPFSGVAPVPWRLHDNMLTGYAVYGSWSDAMDRGLLRAWIEDALLRDPRLADNSRRKMRRNGGPGAHPYRG